MNDIIIPILSVVAVADIILGLVVVSRGIKSTSDIIFGCITLTLIIWSIAIIGFYSQDYRQLISWISITHSSALLISFFFLFFSLNFPNKLKESKLVIVISSIFLVSLIYLIFLTDTVIGHTSGFTYRIGNAYIYYSSVLVIYFFIGFFFLLKQFKRVSDVVQKKQIEYVLIGYLVSSTLAIIPDLIFPFFNIFQYTWLGPIFALILVTSLFIAILKYQLFQVKIILTEIISIVIIVSLLIELFFVQSIVELFLKTIVLIIVACFSFFLIKGVYREVSQREKIEKLAAELKVANTRLLDLDKQKSEFVSFASHQLRAPLTAMRGYASLLLEGEFGQISKETFDAISRILESAKTLANIVDDYLNVSRIELGTMKYAFEVLNFKELVENVIEEIKPNIIRSGLELRFHTNPSNKDERFMVKADKDKIKQVVINLIDNSVKYTTRGYIDVSVSKDLNNRKIIFSVRDTGVGISPEVMPKLFSKFVRANSANKQNIYGTGLGLFVAKDVVTAHKGRIWAESDGEGKGSVFFVELDIMV